jgi:hypothetical protein
MVDIQGKPGRLGWYMKLKSHDIKCQPFARRQILGGKKGAT